MKTVLNVSAGLGYVIGFVLWLHVDHGPAVGIVTVLLGSICLGLGRLVQIGERLEKMLGLLPLAPPPK